MTAPLTERAARAIDALRHDERALGAFTDVPEDWIALLSTAVWLLDNMPDDSENAPGMPVTALRTAVADIVESVIAYLDEERVEPR